MNTVKFRGISKVSNMPVFGSLIMPSEDVIFIKTQEMIYNNKLHPIIKTTLGLHTGCRDLEGTPIYEHDTIKEIISSKKYIVKFGEFIYKINLGSWIFKLYKELSGLGFYLQNITTKENLIFPKKYHTKRLFRIIK